MYRCIKIRLCDAFAEPSGLHFDGAGGVDTQTCGKTLVMHLSLCSAGTFCLKHVLTSACSLVACAAPLQTQ